MPRTQLILLGRLPLPDKIAQCLGVLKHWKEDISLMQFLQAL